MIRLKQLRTENDVNQSDVAELLDVTRQAYSRYECGERELGFHRVLPPNFYFAFRQGRQEHRARYARAHSKEVNRKSTKKDKIIAYR